MQRARGWGGQEQHELSSPSGESFAALLPSPNVLTIPMHECRMTFMNAASLPGFCNSAAVAAAGTTSADCWPDKVSSHHNHALHRARSPVVVHAGSRKNSKPLLPKQDASLTRSSLQHAVSSCVSSGCLVVALPSHVLPDCLGVGHRHGCSCHALIAWPQLP